MTARTCALEGCAESIAGRRANTRFCNEAHRQEDYRRRVKAAAKANGLPVSLNLESVQAIHSPRKRSGDAPKARKSGQSIRVSYRKAVDAVAGYLDEHMRPGDPRAKATEILSPLLTERQKEALRDAA